MHPPPSPARANFTLMNECTPESSRCCSVLCALIPGLCSMSTVHVYPVLLYIAYMWGGPGGVYFYLTILLEVLMKLHVKLFYIFHAYFILLLLLLLVVVVVLLVVLLDHMKQNVKRKKDTPRPCRSGLVMATLAKRKRTKASIMVFSSISKRSEHLR